MPPTTVLNRLGKKGKKIANLITPHFAPHEIYIEYFFGAGGMFFNKPLSAYNFVNDLDKDVYNFWHVFTHHNAEFLEQCALMPNDANLFQYWRKHNEPEPIMQAVRFYMLSNFGYIGKPQTMSIGADKSKAQIHKNAAACLKYTAQIKSFTCADFRDVLGKIAFKIDTDENGKETRNEKIKTFIYADPPYLNTGSNYNAGGWREKDTIDLFQNLVNSQIKFAISEFQNPIILELAKSHNLHVIQICERQTMKSRNSEILILNYDSPELSKPKPNLLF